MHCARTTDQCINVMYYRYQLVYACGSPVELPSQAERVAAIQALLCAVSELSDTHSVLHTPGVAVWSSVESRWVKLNG